MRDDQRERAQCVNVCGQKEGGVCVMEGGLLYDRTVHGTIMPLTRCVLWFFHFRSRYCGSERGSKKRIKHTHRYARMIWTALKFLRPSSGNSDSDQRSQENNVSNDG